jgi:hypothetical protein
VDGEFSVLVFVKGFFVAGRAKGLIRRKWRNDCERQSQITSLLWSPGVHSAYRTAGVNTDRARFETTGLNAEGSDSKAAECFDLTGTGPRKGSAKAWTFE